MHCRACGRTVRSVGFQHLRSCSGLTVAEYRARYPGAPLRDEDVIRSAARHGARNGRYRGRSTRACERCGAALDRHTRGVHCRRCRDRRAAANPFFGRRHSDATRARMREAAARRDPAGRRGGGGSSERLSAGRRRWWATKSEQERAALLQAFIAAGQRSNRRSRRTRIEQIVRSWLEGTAIAFEQNRQVGRYNVDFLIGGSLAVECFGDVWHANPELYPPEARVGALGMRAAEKWGRDLARARRLAQGGLRILFLWERDIRHRPDWAQRRLSTFLATYADG